MTWQPVAGHILFEIDKASAWIVEILQVEREYLASASTGRTKTALLDHLFEQFLRAFDNIFKNHTLPHKFVRSYLKYFTVCCIYSVLLMLFQSKMLKTTCPCRFHPMKFLANCELPSITWKSEQGKRSSKRHARSSNVHCNAINITLVHHFGQFSAAGAMVDELMFFTSRMRKFFSDKIV